MSPRTLLAFTILAAGTASMVGFNRWQTWDFDAWYRAEYSRPSQTWMTCGSEPMRDTDPPTTQPATEGPLRSIIDNVGDGIGTCEFPPE